MNILPLSATAAITYTGMLGLNAINTDTVSMKSDITRHAFEYDDNGFVTKIIYMRDNRQTPVPVGGFASLNMEYDERGRCTLWSIYGPEGLPALTKRGISSGKMEYNERDNLVFESYFGPDGRQVFLPEGDSSQEERTEGN